jgi:hypothetical protein
VGHADFVAPASRWQQFLLTVKRKVASETPALQFVFARVLQRARCSRIFTLSIRGNDFKFKI